MLKERKNRDAQEEKGDEKGKGKRGEILVG